MVRRTYILVVIDVPVARSVLPIGVVNDETDEEDTAG